MLELAEGTSQGTGEAMRRAVRAADRRCKVRSQPCHACSNDMSLSEVLLDGVPSDLKHLKGFVAGGSAPRVSDRGISDERWRSVDTRAPELLQAQRCLSERASKV